ncbi:MAG: hypothetical protein ACRCZJ_02715 [Erysipelotrichaceae bacterium]
MPNYCINRVCLLGKHEEVERIFEHTKSKTSVLDFQKIVPMPESIKQTIHGSVGFASEAVWMYQNHQKITNYMAWLMERNGWELEGLGIDIAQYEQSGLIDLDLGKRIVRNREQYQGCGDWYEWSLKFWGTKWDACDAYRENDDIFFETAWSPPLALLKSLSKQYPEVKVITWYYEPGFLLAGKFVCESGRVLVDETYEEATLEYQTIVEMLS